MKKHLLILLLSIVIIGCEQNKLETLTHESIKIDTEKSFDKLVEIRRDFQKNPELAGKEERTQKIIHDYLLGLGLEVKTDVYGYSVVGILNGDKKGKKIAWRADMDALPNDISGAHHGCGHDVHMAIGLGIAEVLAKHKANINGTVYFIFQPEEETFVGAKKMIDNGLLSIINPDEIYSLHVTALPVGQIMVKPNEMFAHQRQIQIKLKNELDDDKINELNKNIYNLLSRIETNSKPWEIQNIDNPDIGLIHPNTSFKDYLIIDKSFKVYSENNELFIETTIYETNLLHLQNIIPKITLEIEKNGLKDQLLKVSFTQENPTVINDERLTTSATTTLNRIYGNDAVVTSFGQIPFFNDDFAYFQQKIPGVYFFLGGSNGEKGIVAMNHAPNFEVDEACIKTGVMSFSSLLLERVNQK